MSRAVVDRSFLAWPFFDDAHRALAREVEAVCEEEAAAWSAFDEARATDVDAACRRLVRRLAERGLLRLVVPQEYGGARPRLDVRSLCIVRETLARYVPLADFAFAMQGLGSGPISLFGSAAQRQLYLPRVAAGDFIAAFALSEPEAGSDVGAMRTAARREGDAYIIDGEKTWISNGGIADFYVVFARVAEEGERAFGAFIVDADAPGLTIAERLTAIAAHPLARLMFTGCRVGASARVGAAGSGMQVALGTLDVFRSTVGAAALGFARRALAEAAAHARERHVFGAPLLERQFTQGRLADMAVDVDASALLVYRAAWMRDTCDDSVRRQAAMAKLYATEAAQRVVDSAVQLLGARGVQRHNPVEQLYREVRALRIYEGTSEVQRLVIAKRLWSDDGAEEVSSGA
ncbi:MAG: acyl-CoA dehydrogenase family protein [Gemmatimonadaceae bacterium]